MRQGRQEGEASRQDRSWGGREKSVKKMTKWTKESKGGKEKWNDPSEEAKVE